MEVKFVLSLLALTILAGCSNRPEPVTLENLNVSCISGVQYYHYAEKHRSKGYGNMAPAYNRDGTLKLC